MADKDLHVLIIGAGISGLLIAQGLKKAGISYSIFDSEASANGVQKRDWGMGVHWSRPLLEKLLPIDLWNRLKEIQVDPSFDTEAASDYVIPFYNAKTGEHLKSMPMAHLMRASRRKTRAFSAQGIDVQYEKKLVDIEYGDEGSLVKASFADGSDATGTILVGADGHRSAVRHLLLGKDKGALQPIAGGIQLSGTSLCYHDAEKSRHLRQLHPINWAGFHPDFPMCVWMALADVPHPEKPETWIFQIMPSWAGPYDPGQTDAQRLAMLKERAHKMAEPFKSAFLWIPDGTPMPQSNLMQWVTTPWDNRGGTVTLAGDSAHAMPPHRGQGLNHAIQDVSNLVDALKKVHTGEESLSIAIDAYDAELVKRGSDEVKTSSASAVLTHDFAKLMEAPVMKQGYVKTELK